MSRRACRLQGIWSSTRPSNFSDSAVSAGQGPGLPPLESPGEQQPLRESLVTLSGQGPCEQKPSLANCRFHTLAPGFLEGFSVRHLLIMCLERGGARRPEEKACDASSSLSNSTGSESAPGAFQFVFARIACNVSAYVGFASSDIGSPTCDRDPGGGGGGAFLRCCTFSTMDVWSAGDLVLSRLPKNLYHHRRMPPLSRSRLPFSSLMACCPSVFLPPRPTVLFRCLYRPSCRGVGEVSLDPPHTPPSGSLYPCRSPLALPYTQLEVLSSLPWCV